MGLLSVVSETHILSTNMQAKVLQALENAGVFTSGGLVKDKVFKSSFLRQSCTSLIISNSFPMILSKQEMNYRYFSLF